MWCSTYNTLYLTENKVENVFTTVFFLFRTVLCMAMNITVLKRVCVVLFDGNLHAFLLFVTVTKQITHESYMVKHSELEKI